jgi:hypothetical protein
MKAKFKSYLLIVVTRVVPKVRVETLLPMSLHGAHSVCLLLLTEVHEGRAPARDQLC